MDEDRQNDPDDNQQYREFHGPELPAGQAPQTIGVSNSLEALCLFLAFAAENAAMDEYRRLDARQLARAKVRSRRRRISLIRQRTISGSLALFAIAWTVIFGQLALGRDPALSDNRAVAPRPGGAVTAQAPPADSVQVETAPVTAAPPASTPAPVVTASS